MAIAHGVEVALIDPTNGNTIRTLDKHSGRVTALHFSRKGDFLATASGVPGKFGEVRLYDLKTGKAIRTLTGHKDALYGLDVSSDGKLDRLGGLRPRDRHLGCRDRRAQAFPQGTNDAVYALAFSPDGTKLASAAATAPSRSGASPRANGSTPSAQPLQDQYAVAFSADGNKLFGVGADNRVRVWSISKTGVEGTNNLEQSKFAHEGAILQLAMSLDGKTFATASQDRVVKIWRTDSVTEIGVLEKQSDWPAAIALSPNGSLLAVGRRDGSAEIYSTANQKSVRKLENKPPAKPTVVALTAAQPGGVERGAKTKLLLVGDGIHQDGVDIKFSNSALSATIDGKSKTSEGKEALSISVTTKADAKRKASISSS